MKGLAHRFIQAEEFKSIFIADLKQILKASMKSKTC